MPELNSERINREWISVNRYGTYVSNKMKASLVVSFNEIMRAGNNQTEVLVILKEQKKVSYELLIALLLESSSVIAKAAAQQAKDQVDIKPRIVVTEANIKSSLNRQPMVTVNATSKDLHHTLYDSISRKVRAAMLLSVAAEETRSQLNKRLQDILDQSTRQIEMVSLTSNTQVANEIRQQVFSKTKRNADRVMWSSTLDHRTSDYCKVADGKIFFIDSGPRPPAHPRCRSQMLLMAKDMTKQELRDQISPRPAVEAKGKEIFEDKGIKTKGGKIRYPSRTDRSPLKGTTTIAPTYEVWIRSQPKYYQEAVLGKNATKRLRSGESLSKVINDRNSSLNLTSLNEALN